MLELFRSATFLATSTGVKMEIYTSSATDSFEEDVSAASGNPRDVSDSRDVIEGLLLDSNGFVVPINGYLCPLIFLFTLVTNSLVCAILVRKNMRTPTNVLLVAIAVSDLLTGVWPLPCYIFFFTMGRYVDWVPYNWCFLYYCLTDFLPTIFHTASIWLTVSLAGQRYVYVCHAFLARTICNVTNIARIIGAIFTAAIIFQISRFLESEYIPSILPSRVVPNETVEGCQPRLVPWVQENINVYFNVYYWFRVIFIHMVPCTVLIILTACLVIEMRRAHFRRQQLLKENRRSECRRLADSNLTTLMLTSVVGLFLLVEFPLAILIIIFIVQNTFEINLIESHVSLVASLIINLFIMLSYPLNFFIYCGMSRQFRQTFIDLFHTGSRSTTTTGVTTVTELRIGCDTGKNRRDLEATTLVEIHETAL